MDPNQETKKLKDEEGIDRISDLPDPILCKILSFLPTKTAMSTALLSTRWKTLFPFFWIPPIVIDLDDTLFLTPENYDDNSIDNFSDFTDKLFNETLADVCCIESFKLKTQNPYSDELIISWVYEALELNVRELSLEVRLYNSEESFETLDGCTTLTRLELGKAFDLFLPDDFNISLPNLTTLVLDEITFIDELHDFIGLFPALDDLTFSGCVFEHREYFVIESAVLKKLTLDECGEKSTSSFLFDTPNVEVLWFWDVPAKDYIVPNLKSLRKAIIDVALPLRLLFREEYDAKEDEDPPHIQFADGVSNLVEACSSTIHLFLGHHTIEALHHSSAQLPVFQSLNSFALSLGFHGWEILARLLCNAPNLTRLRIGEEYRKQKQGGFSSFISFMPSRPPICLELHLKEIEFWVFKETEDEIKLVEYFLNNGKAIQTLKLGCLPFKDERTPRRLGMLPGHSKIVFQKGGSPFGWFDM